MKEITNFKRQELFNHYNSCDNPFIIITVKIDVTNVVEFCKTNKNFYGTLGYLVTKTVNQIDAYKYRYIDNKIYYCDKVNSNYTENYGEDMIGYFPVTYQNDYNKYIEEFKLTKKEYVENKIYNTENKYDEIWLSCAPWFKFTALVPPFSKSNTIPQFIWDKYELENDKYYVNMLIMLHHGFGDGSHIAEFIETLNKEINNFK